MLKTQLNVRKLASKSMSISGCNYRKMYFFDCDLNDWYNKNFEHSADVNVLHELIDM